MFCTAELANVEQKTTILLQTQITSEELSVEAKVGLLCTSLISSHVLHDSGLCCCLA